VTLRALIFDVDGTLADTEEGHRQAFEAAFLEHKLPWKWPAAVYVDLLRTTGGKERVLRFVESLDLPEEKKAALRERVPAIHATKTDRFAELVAKRRVPPAPGIARLVRDARDARLKLAIASATTPTNIHALIPALLGSDAKSWFGVIVTGDVVANKKPAPDIYQLALERLELGAEECVVFEDSEPGVIAATTAGIFTVAVPTRWTARHDLSRADLVLPSLGDPADPLRGEAAERLGAGWLDIARLRALHGAARGGAGGSTRAD
jgi:HAD superfamily hydrolase (TIGR01509 family)